jgi:hypothetical protein
MTTETMNVHQALAELKMMENRIDAAITEGSWVVANKHSNQKLGGVEVKDWVADVKSRYQKVTDLIRRRDAIKRAVVNSNAVTKVEVAGVIYTVAEAIDKKNTGVDFLKHFARKLASEYSSAKMTADRANGAELDRRADEHVRVMLGETDRKGMTADAQRIRNEFVEAQTMELVDPIGIRDVITKLDEEISSFLTNVDAALSVSNALTTITIEY